MCCSRTVRMLVHAPNICHCTAPWTGHTATRQVVTEACTSLPYYTVEWCMQSGPPQQQSVCCTRVAVIWKLGFARSSVWPLHAPLYTLLVAMDGQALLPTMQHILQCHCTNPHSRGSPSCIAWHRAQPFLHPGNNAALKTPKAAKASRTVPSCRLMHCMGTCLAL